MADTPQPIIQPKFTLDTSAAGGTGAGLFDFTSFVRSVEYPMAYQSQDSTTSASGGTKSETPTLADNTCKVTLQPDLAGTVDGWLWANKGRAATSVYRRDSVAARGEGNAEFTGPCFVPLVPQGGKIGDLREITLEMRINSMPARNVTP
jgi:hypothetical protein